MAEPWVQEVLDFWFGLTKEQWFTADAELDEACRGHFLEVWEEQRQSSVSAFLASPREALAAVILFDQMPRNMLRGHADQFATDHIALAIAREGVDRGYDDALTPAERGIFYMPFQHSERLEDQQRAVSLFTALGDDYQLGFAKKHHDVIERFDRFPHRNAVLGREPRPAEIEAGDVVPW